MGLVSGGADSSGYGLATWEIYDPISETWTAVPGSMNESRVFHTATLLRNGRVLIAGGASDTSFSPTSRASAELYDPVDGTWSETGSMANPRARHTATLLSDGRVLVAGGINSSSLSSAEIYDPSTGTWSPAGSMADARVGHTATLLPDGQVLAVGGDAFSGSAEVFDPTAGGGAGAWSATGSMADTRFGHTATLLPNGKLLATGGITSIFAFVNSAELYDPIAGTWSAAGSMNDARLGHGATLLSNGRVLLVGGADSAATLTSSDLYSPGK
jgi:N-acetylneuraminic acid mutarotase